MQAIAVRDRDASLAGLSLTDLPYPHASENDVIVRVHAAGFTPGELAWAGTWTDRSGRISGLTAWQALFDHAHLLAGQTALIHGAAGSVGSTAVQLARQAGSRVIGTGRAADRDRALSLGVEEFVDLETDGLEGAGEPDVALDVIGGDILKRSIALLRAGGTLVTTIEPPTIQPENGRATFFVVEADRSQLVELAQRLRDGRLTSNVGAVRPLTEAPAAFGPNARHASGKTIIQVIEGW